MFRHFLFMALSAWSASFVAAESASVSEAQTKLPISVFSSDTAIRTAQISPDGSYLAVVFRQDGEEKLAVLDLQTRKPLSSFFVRGRNRSVGDVTWVANDRLVYGTR